jgi:hypothetical protein
MISGEECSKDKRAFYCGMRIGRQTCVGLYAYFIRNLDVLSIFENGKQKRLFII